MSADPANKLNVANRSLFHGDNLPFLRAINSDSIHLIATDPPFNKGRDFHATPASLASGASFQDRWSWEDDVQQAWVDQITDDHPKLMEAIESARYAHSDGMGAYMCFMAVRLLEMRRVLREDGSIYLHCDPTASHYLKAIMDAIFVAVNFRNEIVWCYTGNSVPKRNFQRKHDIVLFYSKSRENKFELPSAPYSEATLRRYNHVDKDGRRYKMSALRSGLEKVYAKEGKPMEDWWTDIPVVRKSRERLGYPTQKPLAFYERIIKASSSEGDVVLDPFCGCATTLVAAERLNRQWIGIDIWDKAHETVIRRLQDEGLAAPDGDTGGRLFTAGQIAYSKEPPVRTDEGEEAVPFLRTKLRVDEPKDRRMSRAEMLAFLLDQNGSRCQGCDREFDDPRYLELDHNTPRSDGGLNHISNRILLCGPCNKLKSNRFTLSGLRRENKKLGYMAG